MIRAPKRLIHLVSGANPLPLDATNIAAWYRFDSMTKVNGLFPMTLDTSLGVNTVATLHDITGNGNDYTQTTKSKQPEFTGSRVFFDGVDDEMEGLGGILDIFKGITSYALYLVIEPTAQKVQHSAFWSVGTSTTTTRVSMLLPNDTKMNYVYRRLDADSSTTLGSAATAAYEDVKMLYEANGNHTLGHHNLYKNTTVIQAYTGGTTGAFSNTSSQRARLGSSGAANYLEGYLYEMIIAREYSTIDQTNIRAYLDSRHNLSY